MLGAHNLFQRIAKELRPLKSTFPATASPGMRGANFVELPGSGAASAGTRQLNPTARAVWVQACGLAQPTCSRVSAAH
jgi:hypothetical protein